jgi:hypothetical protein
VSKVDLRLQCGMPCSKLEVSTVQHGTLSGAGYLHQSQKFVPPSEWAKLALYNLAMDWFIDPALVRMKLESKWPFPKT